MSSSDGLPPDGSPPSLPPEIAPNAPDASAALDRVSDGFLTLDADGRVTYVNEAAAQALGRVALTDAALGDESPDGLGARLRVALTGAALQAETFLVEAFSEALGRWFECRVFPGAAGSTVFLRDVTERRETRRRLEQNEQRSRSLFEQNVDAVFSFDLAGRFTEANAACLAVSGYSPEELRGTSFLPLVSPEDRERIQGVFQRAVEGTPQHEEIAILHKSGRRVEVNIAKAPIVVDGAVVGVYGIAKDITDRKEAEAGPVPMTITRWSDGTVFYANRHVRDLFGVPSDQEVVGSSTERFFVSPDDRAHLIAALTARGHVQNWEAQARRADGTTFWAGGTFQRMVYRGEDAIFSVYGDISAQRRLLDAARAEAERDSVTGLLNHRAFHLRLEEESGRARQGGKTLAVAVFDLNHFKFFNDAYTHAAGDEVLRSVADALRAACRAGDSLARLGGDEFALLMPDVGPSATSDGVRARLSAGAGDLSDRPPARAAPSPSACRSASPCSPPRPRRARPSCASPTSACCGPRPGRGAARASRVRAALHDSARGFPMLDALVTSVDARDRYTRRHSEAVLAHGLRLARALGLEGGALRAAGAAALLLDVGEIGVPAPVLRKPGALTAEESAAVRTHPLMGALIVGAAPGFGETFGDTVGDLLGAIRHHHERWDGGGYRTDCAARRLPKRPACWPSPTLTRP